MIERSQPLSIFEENENSTLEDFRRADQSVRAKQLYTEMIKNATKMRDPELVDSLLEIQLKKPEERYSRFISDKKSDLPDVAESLALVVADPEEKKREILIAKFTGNNNPIDYYSYADLQVYNQNRVRDVYLLMGLGRHVDFIPQIPEKTWRGRRQTEVREFYKEDYGLGLTFKFHSDQKPVAGEENQAHVVLQAGLRWPSY